MREDTQADAELTVDPVPVLVIAGTASDGSIVFEAASGATRLSTGTIVVGDALARAVRFIDTQGRLVASVGRQGQGPGEFDHIEWLGQCARDSVFIWDSDLGRITIIDATAAVVATYRIPEEPAVAPPTRVSCSRHGVFALIGTPEGMASAWARYSASLLLTDTRGRIIMDVGEVPAFEGNPLGKVTDIAVGDSELYVGTKDSAFVDVYTLTGDHAGVLPIGTSRRVATTEHFERAIDAQVAQLAAVSDREFLKGMLMQRPMPDYMPAHGPLLTDPAGLLWVQISLPGDPDTHLRVLRADGTLAAEVRIAPYLRVFDVGKDYVLGGYEDDESEPFLAMYEVVRR
jgi:hypothetical protein